MTIRQHVSHSERSCCRHCHPCMLDLLHRTTRTYVGVAEFGQEWFGFKTGLPLRSVGTDSRLVPFRRAQVGLCRVWFALLSVGVPAVRQWPLGPSVSILMHFFGMCLSSRGAGNSSELLGGRVATIADQSLFTPIELQPLGYRHCRSVPIGPRPDNVTATATAEQGAGALTIVARRPRSTAFAAPSARLTVEGPPEPRRKPRGHVARPARVATRGPGEAWRNTPEKHC